MTEQARMRLLGVSFWQPLFKYELKKIIEKTEKEDMLDLLIYCYQKYSDMHPEVLADIFTEFQNQNEPETVIN